LLPKIILNCSFYSAVENPPSWRFHLVYEYRLRPTRLWAEIWVAKMDFDLQKLRSSNVYLFYMWTCAFTSHVFWKPNNIWLSVLLLAPWTLDIRRLFCRLTVVSRHFFMTFLRFPPRLPNIFSRFSHDFPKISTRFPNIVSQFSHNFPRIYSRLLDVFSTFSHDFPKISPRLPNIFSRFSHSFPKISTRFPIFSRNFLMISKNFLKIIRCFLEIFS